MSTGTMLAGRDAGRMDWMHNDGLFAAELERGHVFASLVAQRLRLEGLAARATPMELRASVQDRHRFTRADVDVTVFARSAWQVLEIKSRRLRFSGPHDWPASHDPAMIDTRAGWDAKEHRPVAVVLVSQITRGMAVVPVSSRPFWRVVRTHDRRRDVPTVSYACPAEHLRSFGTLLDWLREGES